MTVKTSSFLLLLLAGLLFFNSCKNDMDEIIEEEVEELEIPATQSDLVDLSLYSPDVQRVKTAVVGLITDENNLPIEGALVTLDKQEYLTDNLGRFVASNVVLNTFGSVYTVEKAGYFKGVRRFTPQERAVEQTRVQLKKKKIAGSFHSSVGGIVSTPDELIIEFSPNSIVDNNGNAVNGNVQVTASWIDPRVSEQLPGSLIGLNSALEEVPLISYSMAAVELTVNGEEVNIAPGKYAMVAFPIPQEIRSGAPEEIPLWSLEEDLGLWIEEGVALKNGNFYLGNVSHFSFWNCDVPPDPIEIKGTLKNQDGDPVAGIKVKATSSGFGVLGASISNSSGLFGGPVPRGEKILLEFINGDCESREMEIGPFDSVSNLGDVVLDMDLGTIRGRVTACQGEVVENAFVEIESTSFQLPTFSNENGEFSVGYSILCDPPSAIFVRAMVDGTLFQSEQEVLMPSDDVDFGDVAVCDEVQYNPNQSSCGTMIGGNPQSNTNLTALGYLTTENEQGKLILLVSSEQMGFKITTLFPFIDPTSNQYDPANWELGINTPLPIDFFSFSEQSVGVEGTADQNQTVLYRCGPGNDESIEDEVYFPECSDIEFSISQLSLNPIPNGDFALMQSGNFIICQITGTLPNGESLEINLHKVF